MPSHDENGTRFEELLKDEPTKRDQQIEELQQELADLRDARKEERFVYIVVLILLLDIVFFTVMPSFGGPIALIILQLLILIPLARRMGMQEIAKSFDRVLGQMAGRSNHSQP